MRRRVPGGGGHATAERTAGIEAGPEPPVGGGPAAHPAGAGAVTQPTAVELARSPLSQVAADRLAALAAQAAGAPTGMVQLVDDDVLLLYGGFGLPQGWQILRSMPLRSTLAGWVFNHGAPLVVEDLAADPRVPPDAPVLAIGTRAYAGFPVRDTEGRVVGACCVFDYAPRTWSAAALTAVDHAAQVCTSFVAEKLARRQADRDRRFLDAVLDSLRDGVAACDVSGRMVLANAALRAVAPVDLGAFSAVRPTAEGNADANARGNLCRPDGQPLEPHEAPLARALHGERIRQAEVMVKVEESATGSSASTVNPSPTPTGSGSAPSSRSTT